MSVLDQFRAELFPEGAGKNVQAPSGEELFAVGERGASSETELPCIWE